MSPCTKIFILSSLLGIAVSWPIQSSENVNMVYIGTADGKSYFADTFLGTWQDAKNYCELSKMKLASIQTSSQLALLKSTYLDNPSDDHYWMAGRDAQSINKFVWDDDKSSPNSTLIQLESYYLPPLQFCLAYVSKPDGGEFHAHLCNEYGTVSVICDIQPTDMMYVTPKR